MCNEIYIKVTAGVAKLYSKSNGANKEPWGTPWKVIKQCLKLDIYS